MNELTATDWKLRSSSISLPQHAVIDGRKVLVESTVFDVVRNTMKVAREEIFGPVLSVMTVSGVEQAVAVANDTFYGLAAGVWSNNVKTALRVAKAVRAGVVWVNCFDVGRMSVAFGGVKQSGFGRDKSLHALDKYSYVKSVWLAH